MAKVVLTALGLIALVFAISYGSGMFKPGRSASLYSQRTVAVLQSQRDSETGYQAAIEVLQKVTASKEAVFGDWLNLARAFVLHPKRGKEAAPAIARAREIGADARELAALDYVEGVHRRGLQEHAKAHELFKKVLATLPDHPEALYQCGYTAENAELYDDAKQRYEQLLELKLLIRPAAYRLSQVCAVQKDEAGVRRALDLFNSRSKDEKPETTKCDLTDLSLRVFDRKTVEADAGEISWDTSKVEAPEALRRAVPFPEGPFLEGGDATAILLLLGEKSLFVRRGEATPENTGISLSGDATAVVLDIDNKPDYELLVADRNGFRALSRQSDGSFQPTETRFPELADGAPPLAMCALDADHDGDVDVVMIGGGPGNRFTILRNNGDRSFAYWTPFSLTNQPAGDLTRIDGHDFDQANDIDLLFPGDGSGAVLLLNLREEKYRPERIEALTGRSILIGEDFDNDGAPDIFGTGGTPGWTLLRNSDRRGRKHQVRFEKPQSEDSLMVVDAVSGDIDNDGDLDVLLGTESGLVVLRNTQGGKLVAQQPVPVENGIRSLSAADLGADGTLDIIAIDGAGGLHVLTPNAATKFDAVLVAPTGRKDNRGSIGVVTEVYADKQFQSLMHKSPFGARFGLGPAGRRNLDGLRTRWPQGIRQSVPRPELEPIEKRLVFKQIEGLVASCPFLYTLGSDGWRFQTDVIGIAPLAEWLPPGGTPHLDPEEFVRIPGENLVVRDGRAKLAITEELKETCYIDRVELYFVDHAEDVELLIDENLTQGAYDDLDIHTFDKNTIHDPATVTVRGQDVTDQIKRADGVFLHPYIEEVSQWGGWTEPHTTEITTAAPTSLLIMRGRMAWYDSTVSYALAQNGRTWTPMRVDLVTADGSTDTLVANAGLPTGMDRSILVKVAGDTPLPAGSKLRITSQYRNLWDRIRTSSGANKTQPKLQQAELEAADVYFHGYSKIVADVSRHEQSYEFGNRETDDRYPKARGFVNGYGDALPLLTEHDDRLVILVAGDAVNLTFEAPPPPPNTRRTWFLRISGWAKESSFHNRTGLEVAPLPFRAMTSYPPPHGQTTSWQDAEAVLTRRIR